MKKRNNVPDKTYETAIRWLARLESPEITDEQVSDFQAWLSSSEINQVAYLKAEQLWQRGEVLARVDNAQPGQATASISLVERLFGKQSYAVYALGSLLLFAVIAWPTLRGDSGEVFPFDTAIGEQRLVVLPDDSEAHLNTNTSISYQEVDGVRRLYLRNGEIFLDVRSMPDKPFEVSLDDAVVRVLGTQFGVRRDGDKSRVSVLEGRVGLAKKESQVNDKFTADVILTGNQQVTLTATEGPLAVEDVDTDTLMSWRKKVLVYQGVPLQQVVNDINRYFDTQIILEGESLGEKQVVASMKLTDFQTVSGVIAASLGLKTRTDPESLHLILYEAPATDQ